VQQVRLNRFAIKGVWRAPVGLGQRFHTRQIRFLRPLREAAQHHRVTHPLAQFGHLVLLIQIGNIPNDEDRMDDVQFKKLRLLRTTIIQKQQRGGRSPHHRVCGLVQR
jgi:hypothetical protein